MKKFIFLLFIGVLIQGINTATVSAQTSLQTKRNTKIGGEVMRTLVLDRDILKENVTIDSVKIGGKQVYMGFFSITIGKERETSITNLVTYKKVIIYNYQPDKHDEYLLKMGNEIPVDNFVKAHYCLGKKKYGKTFAKKKIKDLLNEEFPNFILKGMKPLLGDRSGNETSDQENF